MSMNHLTKLFAVSVFLAFGSQALAQETTPTPEAPATEAPATDAPAAPADGLSMGTEVPAASDGPGSVYLAATHGDWELRCVKAADGSDPCQLYQLLKDDKGNNVAEISMVALEDASEAVAGATIIVPLETLLTEALMLKIDTGKAKVYPFTWCAKEGCIARVGFTAADIDSFKKGNVATLTIVPALAPDQKVNLNLSLKGFTAGYDAVIAANNK